MMYVNKHDQYLGHCPSEIVAHETFQKRDQFLPWNGEGSYSFGSVIWSLS
jgi:hypothetical protein